MQYAKPKRIVLKSHAEYQENWIQSIIADDPGIIGLGDLVLRDRERSQPRAGRLDLLLQDPETKRRYEVELQLGASDETHIIRTIEYWDIERKRYPQYDHVAVLIAEDITSRFLNVVSLFNGFIPLIAIQMQAFNVNGALTLIFTKVLDEMTQGLVDEDEDAESTPTDRPYWENRATKTTLAMADDIFSMVQKLDPKLALNYNKFYIGLTRNKRPCNFVVLQPQKAVLKFRIRLNRLEQIEKIITESGLDFKRQGSEYSIRIRPSELKDNAIRKCLEDLISRAHKEWNI